MCIFQDSLPASMYSACPWSAKPRNQLWSKAELASRYRFRGTYLDAVSSCNDQDQKTLGSYFGGDNIWSRKNTSHKEIALFDVNRIFPTAYNLYFVWVTNLRKWLDCFYISSEILGTPCHLSGQIWRGFTTLHPTQIWQCCPTFFGLGSMRCRICGVAASTVNQSVHVWDCQSLHQYD